jgi:diphthamide synthase subunit DPH2
MSSSHLGHISSEKQKQKARETKAHRVLCVATNQEFESIKSAREWLRTQGLGGDIQCHLQEKQKTAGGYHWQRIILEKTASNAC